MGQAGSRAFALQPRGEVDRGAEVIEPVVERHRDARLQGESAGDDIVLSRALVDDAVVAGLLRAVPAAEETALVRGFPEPVPFCRLTPEAVAWLSAADANGGP